jgi:hypothetical protein
VYVVVERAAAWLAVEVEDELSVEVEDELSVLVLVVILWKWLLLTRPYLPNLPHFLLPG